MGKILFLSDIHGNMPAVYALEKVIDKIQPDDIWFLGDAVGKGPEMIRLWTGYAVIAGIG